MFNLIGRRDIQGTNTHDMIRATTGLYFLQRMKLDKKLCVHNGCVNTICWNEKGTLILSGSDDQHLGITDPFSGKNITKFRSGHRSNIFSAKFMPCSMDKQVVSCSGSGEIFFTDIEREDTYGKNRFDSHFGSAYKLLVVPNEASTFLSCGDDGTVRFFDLRMKTSCSKFNCEEDVLILLGNAVTSMAVDPVIPYQLAVSTSDGIVRLFDRRMLKSQDTHAMNESLIFKFSPPMASLSQSSSSNGGRQRSYRVTSLNYRPGSHDLLVNYSSENIYLFNTYDIRQKMSFSAASQVATQQSTSSGIKVTETGGQASTSRNDHQAVSTNQEASASVASSPPSDAGSESELSSFKPIKRLRLRGDWSDTGPDARPGGEEPAQNIMQRMSDLLTRMLNSHGNQEEADERDENESNEVLEELQEHPGDQDQASGSPEQQEPGRMVGSETAAAVTLGAMGLTALGSRTERDVTGSSISSEGMASHDLSPQDLELPTDPLVDTNSGRTNTNDSTITTSEPLIIQRQEASENMQISDQTLLDRSSGVSTQLQLSDQNSVVGNRSFATVHSQHLNPCEPETLEYEETDTRPDDCDSKQFGVSSSSSEETPSTVICVSEISGNNVEKISSASGHNDKTSHHGPQEMIVQGEHSSRETNFEGMDYLTEESGSNEKSPSVDCKVTVSSKITPFVSGSTEESSLALNTDVGLESVSNYHTVDKPIQTLQQEAGVVSPHLSNPSSSVVTSDSVSVASLWSSDSSATTVAIAEDGLSIYNDCNSQQTICGISSCSSLRTPASSISDISPSEHNLGQCAQAGHGLGLQRQRPGTYLSPGNEKTNSSDSEVLEAAESGESFNQDYKVKMSSVVHSPCESCGKTQSFEGKGKGAGKSSCKQKPSTKSDGVTTGEKFSSYNSGKMRVASDAQPDNDEAGTSGMGSTNVSSASKGSERRRRHGHSLPPTGNFQLYGSDDEDQNEDDDEIEKQRRARSNIRTKQDKDRLGKAAQKIQEVFRQRREAREQARIKDVPQPRVFMKFSGHRNCRTVIKEANFYGDEYVMSGSDCGRIMFWERQTGRLVMYLNADKHVVNCVQPNPYSPVLASSGIDYDVKIWCPLEEDSQFDEEKSAEIIKCNERMLEVTRDTVTVPAAFMLRILASLSQVRNGRGSTAQQRQAPESSNQD
ncbi:hypothetical protein EGW08_019095 [Elysia chlorotica]|uniref:Uncharacterized protein n=1 Tax=Elysia chlorotica TaxID=188477 RepID=A0A3S0ZQU8_ELYCH|nr:hypothetical protein EGW08_019095 [Elysia chlorotica]